MLRTKTHFDITSKAPGDEKSNGFYTIQCDDPKVTLGIIDLAMHPDALEGDEEYGSKDDVPAKEFKVTDGIGSTYHYKVYVSLDEGDLLYEELQEIVDDCWDWFLTWHLL